MKFTEDFAPALRRITIALAATTITGPALADHLGPSGLGGGSGLDVFSPDTLDAGHAGIGLRLVYTKPQGRSDGELEALAAGGIDAHNSNYNLNASLGLAYGVTHHLTIAADLPYVRRDHLREGSDQEGARSVEDLGSVSGIGDLSILAKYRLTGEGRVRFALVAGLKLPTGSTDRLDRRGARLETEHQPGTGSWDPVLGASAATRLGGLGLTASLLYQIAGEGAQRTRLGDRVQGGFMVSRHFGPAEQEADLHHDGEEPHHHHHASEHHDSWDASIELGGEWEGRQRIAGAVEQASGGAWVYAAPGLRFNSAAGWSLGAALAIPLWQDIRSSHPDNAYRGMLTFGRSF